MFKKIYGMCSHLKEGGILISEKKVVSQKNEEKPFLEHLIEIKKRILVTIAIFLIFFCISFFTTPYFITILKNTGNDYSIVLNIFKVTESITIYLKIMFFQALSLTIPIVTVQSFLFVKPALEKKVKKWSIFILPIVCILFFIGSTLGYRGFLPIILSFLIEVSASMGINTVYNFTDFFNFAYSVTITFGLLFEMPAILVFLTLIGILTPTKLRNSRKFTYPILCLLAMLITPPELIFATIVMLLMFMLFELSIICSSFVYSLTDNEVAIEERRGENA